uniref:Putative disease resistance protein RPM1-like n=1 Tax=Davidia involucrata TaxID=16924 RepID=A0A5B6ZKS7_DAVIN
MADIAVTVALFLVEKVLSSLHGQDQTVRDEVGDVINRLNTARAYLTHMEGGNEGGNDVLKDRIQQLRDVAYYIEDVLDELMLHAPRRIHRHEVFNAVHGHLHDVKHRKAIQEIPSKIEEIKRKTKDIPIFDSVIIAWAEEGGSSSSSVEHHHVTPHVLEDDEILGFEEPRKQLIRQLTEGESRREVSTISVVGPGGSGKTILVKNVYDSIIQGRQFDCHAWVRVSRSFKINELVCIMLQQFCEEPTPQSHGGADTLNMSKLRNYLQRKRYVVVLDDVWRKDDWRCIKNVLPNGSSGSKIIVTTRKADVASSCVKNSPLALNPLPWPEAWGLFCKKAFQTSCPPELEKWAHEFVKTCEGLPLAIAEVGDLLSKTKHLPIEWKKLHDSLGSEIGTHANLSIISRVFLPSYKDLPSNLRTCFLYFSIFPEDRSIKRGRLIRLWVAEGFVMGITGKTPEEVAEDCLNQLIASNLVHATNWDSDGRVRSCRVLNLVHKFIVSKSVDEKFVSILPQPTTSNSTSSSEKVRRLSIHNACTTLSQSRDFSRVRSAFLFTSPSDIGKILHNFRLLKVLDLQDSPLDKFPEDIVRLILLRYLSLRNTKIKTVPESIKMLSYLETLDLKQTRVTKLPERILLLHSLRHLLVTSHSVQGQGAEVSAGIGALTNLQKLSLVKHRKIIKDLAALTQLRKLGLTELKRKDGKDLCESIQKMKNLLTLNLSSTSKEFLDLDHMPCGPPPHLQRLYLKGLIHKLPGWISSLNDLVKIGLKWSKLQHSPLEALGLLPNLMELQMVDAFIGDELVFGAGRFKKLEILHIEQFYGLNTVLVQQGAMSQLQKLTLCKCVVLQMVPLGIDHLTHLKELILYEMPNEFISLLRNEDRETVSHIHLIHSWTLQSDQSWSFQNLP